MLRSGCLQSIISFCLVMRLRNYRSSPKLSFYPSRNPAYNSVMKAAVSGSVVVSIPIQEIPSCPPRNIKPKPRNIHVRGCKKKKKKLGAKPAGQVEGVKEAGVPSLVANSMHKKASK